MGTSASSTADWSCMSPIFMGYIVLTPRNYASIPTSTTCVWANLIASRCKKRFDKSKQALFLNLMSAQNGAKKPY
jgi:hypothetical protein